jgi:hypothetical protein
MSRSERSATRVVSSTAGVLAAYAGLEHGIGELRQGPTELPDTVFESWPDDPAFEALSGEPAMSLLPTYQAAGVATVAVAVLLGVWSIWFVHRRFGGLVLVALSAALLLVGGGFGPPLLGTIAGVTAMRIGARPPRDPGPVLRTLGHIWGWCLGVAVAAYLALVPGLPLLYTATGTSEPALVLVMTVAAFGALCLAILGARGHDRRRSPSGHEGHPREHTANHGQ